MLSALVSVSGGASMILRSAVPLIVAGGGGGGGAIGACTGNIYGVGGAAGCATGQTGSLCGAGSTAPGQGGTQVRPTVLHAHVCSETYCSLPRAPAAAGRTAAAARPACPSPSRSAAA